MEFYSNQQKKKAGTCPKELTVSGLNLILGGESKKKAIMKDAGQEREQINVLRLCCSWNED